MKITMIRYYGDCKVTKSLVTVEMNGEVMRCEAREPEFVDYEEPFKGSSRVCLPAGMLVGRLRATETCAMSLCIGRIATSTKTVVGYDEERCARCGFVMIGMADEGVPPEERVLHSERETFERFTDLMYRAWSNGERIDIEIINRVSGIN